jgi:uncharacterized protein with ParB-like and HNH nuclease domain
MLIYRASDSNDPVMTTGILPPALKPVEALLGGGKPFAVPKYQRNFSWTKDEVQELWEDASAAVETKKKDYFLGTIVVRDFPASLEIIDGQQRLICLSMIFSAIRNAFLAKDDERAEQVFLQFLGAKDFSRDAVPKPRLVLNEQNNPVYVKFVIGSADSITIAKELKDKSLTESNRLLLDAYKFFLDKTGEKVASLGTKSDEFLEPLINCLKSSVKLITIPVLSEEDAFHIFESLNARGKDLAVSDLVKNRLYAEAGNQVAHAQQLWEKMESDLVRRSIPEYIRHFWIAKRAPKKELKVREKALYRTIAGEAKGPTKSIAMLTGLEESARNYAMIEDYSLWPNDSFYDNSFERTLRDLRLFRVSQCYPVPLNAIEMFADPKSVAETFRIIANFSFRYNIIGGGTSGDLESVFGGIAYGIRQKTHLSPSDIGDTLRGVNPDSKFRSDFDSALIPKSKARLARYVLGKINDHLGGPELIANTDPKMVNLEHVLPQKPNAAWKVFFSSGVSPQDYIYRIGNLTLLTSKINEVVADKSLEKKQEIAFKPSKLNLNGALKRVRKWGDKEIEKRQTEMAKIALQVWKL